MGFYWGYIGRPSTPWALIQTIRNILVNVGWTEVYNNNTDTVVLRTAPYIVPGTNNDWGSGHFLLRVVSSHVEIQGGFGWNSQNLTLTPPTTTIRRFAYSYQSSCFYYIYANEYWFYLPHAYLPGGENCLHVLDSTWATFAGIALPPLHIVVQPTQGFREVPPYKLIFLVSPYDTAGNFGFFDIINNATIFATFQNYFLYQFLPEYVTSNIPTALTSGGRDVYIAPFLSRYMYYRCITPTRLYSSSTWDWGFLPYSYSSNVDGGPFPFEFTIRRQRYILLRYEPQIAFRRGLLYGRIE